MSKANALENEIFDHYRKRVNQIEKSINLLRSHGYTIVDLEGKIIEEKIEQQ
jgi:hypothetical protein|tara:strand:+ start:4030 stop:4185 length:156 start_codon:yes stop_codon:yes gene_type:complete